MKVLHRLLAAALACTTMAPVAMAQEPVLLKRDSGTPNSRDNASKAGWEETIILVPDGPCRLLEVQVYLTGAVAARDTIYIVGDPSEGALPPTSFVWSYNSLTDPIAVDYDGAPKWITIDLRDRDLRYDGYDRIVLQHRVQEQGPWFACDNLAGQPLSSFLYDPATNNQLGFPGVYRAARGDFFVRALVQYDFPEGNGSAPPPAPTLVDVAVEAGLVDGEGRALKSARVSVADWDGDGWDDIAVGGSFFRNRGDGTFENVSATIGIQAGASVWGDFDNDGRIDCYAVNGGAGDRIYRNDGNGTFTDVTGNSGFSNPYPTVMPIWFDFNDDGKLDLFIANGRTEQAGQEEYFPDQLWRGNGDGTFTNITGDTYLPVAEKAGSPDGMAYLDCWGAAPCDYDGDGRTDIFVATYRLAPDLLYRNQGQEDFSEEGEATSVRGVPTSVPYYFGHGIGADWGDYDNDGDADLVVGNLGHPDWRGGFSNPSLVYRNSGAANGFAFEEVHRKLGIKFFEMNAGVMWLDLDNDGYLDLWHCQYAYQAAGGGEPKRLSRIYRSDGEAGEYRFRDITWHTGALVHGAWTAARGDFDRDGDLDLVAASPTEGVKLFRNDYPRNGRSLRFRLVGSPANNVPMDAYGSSIAVYAGGRAFHRDLQGGGGGATATQNSNEIHIGVGWPENVDSVVVTFSDGAIRKFEGVRTNHSYTVTYDGSLTMTSGVDVEKVREGTLRVGHAGFDGEAFTFDIEAASRMGDMHAEVVDGAGRRIVYARIPRGFTGGQRLTPAGSVTSGLYLLRVTSGDETALEKMMIVR